MGTIPFNIPILLTCLRVALIPLIVGVFYLPTDMGVTHFQIRMVSTLFFIVAAVTDWFDGFLARRWNQTSAFGEFLDPVADKLMIAAALIILVSLERVHPIIATIIIGREITISALREWMARVGATKSVAVNSLGKIKTTAQMIAIPLLLYYDKIFGVFDAYFWGNILLLIAAVLTIISMVYYLWNAWPLMDNRIKRYDL